VADSHAYRLADKVAEIQAGIHTDRQTSVRQSDQTVRQNEHAYILKHIQADIEACMQSRQIHTCIHTHRHTGTYTYRQAAGRQTNIHQYTYIQRIQYIHAYTQAVMQAGIHTDWKPNRNTGGRHAYRHSYIQLSTGRQAGRQTYRDTYIQADIQAVTIKHTYMHTCIYTYIHTLQHTCNKPTYSQPARQTGRQAQTYRHTYIHCNIQAGIHTYTYIQADRQADIHTGRATEIQREQTVRQTTMPTF